MRKEKEKRERARDAVCLCGLFEAHRLVVIALVIVVGFNKV